jgi:predicted transglutaminase-like cysteine proteinase
MMRIQTAFYRNRRLFAPLLVGFGMAAAVIVAPVRAETTENGLFGLMEISSDDLSALPMWQHVMASFPALADAAKECDLHIEKCDTQQMTLWRTKIAELQRSAERIQMLEINRFLNDWKHLPEEDGGIRNRWTTPLQFLSHGGGSRDFAVMKYVSLKELGFDPDAMRIVIANDVLRNKTHAVLSVHYRGKQYILDSLNDTILEERLVNYYLPLYSVNEKTRWAHIPQDFLIASEPSGSEKND